MQIIMLGVGNAAGNKTDKVPTWGRLCSSEPRQRLHNHHEGSTAAIVQKSRVYGA